MNNTIVEMCWRINSIVDLGPCFPTPWVGSWLVVEGCALCSYCGECCGCFGSPRPGLIFWPVMRDSCLPDYHKR
eukprot:scaffold198993_cov70-Cyclotella_meneghiniana.AAC.1